MIKKKKLFLIVIVLLILLVSVIIKEKMEEEVSISHKEFLFKPNISTLEGTLVTRMYYGPPGYGEDSEKDKKEYAFILKLDHPINVRTTDDDDINVDASDILEVQLVVTGENADIIKEYENKYLKVKGSFFSSFTGHHHTDVLLRVNEILN